MQLASCIPCLNQDAMEHLGLFPLSVILSHLNETDGVSLLITKKTYLQQILPIFRLSPIALGNETRRRHHFRSVPVQDPSVLLDRLNTRRLFKRRRPVLAGFTTIELARREWHRSNLSVTQPTPFQDPPELELLRFLVSDRESEFYSTLKFGSTLLVSYPRSGNSLVRTLLERTTGIVVGSDTRPDRSLSKELAEQHDLIGEGVTQGAFVKTHWPERAGSRVFRGQRAILLIRNPFDAIDSYWNMNATKSHTRTVTADIYERFRDKWHDLVKNEIDVWNKFNHFWLHCQQCPVLVVRFEDLIRHPGEEVTRMLAFALQRDLPEFWRDRIRHATTKASTAELGSYRPRSASKGVQSIGKSIRNGHYPTELLDFIHHECSSNEFSENYLVRFGYDTYSQNFPSNFVNDLAPNVGDSSDSDPLWNQSGILVNEGQPIRAINCPYGRLFQQWRHSVTKNDEEPLPTVD